MEGHKGPQSPTQDELFGDALIPQNVVEANTTVPEQNVVLPDVAVAEQNVELDVPETVDVPVSGQTDVPESVVTVPVQTDVPESVDVPVSGQTDVPESADAAVSERNIEPDVQVIIDMPISEQDPEAISEPFIPEMLADVPDIQQNVHGMSHELFGGMPNLLQDVVEPGVQQEQDDQPHGSGIIDDTSSVQSDYADDDLFLKLLDCTECPRTFSSYTQLSDHTEVHVQINDGPLVCNFCEKEFHFKSHISNHILMMHEQLECEACGKHFKDKTCLVKHLELHVSVMEKPKPVPRTYSRRSKSPETKLPESKSPEPQSSGSSSKDISEAGPSGKRTRTSRHGAEPGANVQKEKPKPKKFYHADMKTYSRKK